MWIRVQPSPFMAMLQVAGKHNIASNVLQDLWLILTPQRGTSGLNMNIIIKQRLLADRKAV